MSTFALPAATDAAFEQCPVGLFVMRLKELERGIEGSPEYGGGERVKWVFAIERVIDANENPPTRDNPDPRAIEDWIGEDIWGFTSLSMGRKAKMRAWSEALLNREIAEGEALIASDLIGKRGKVTIGRSDTDRAKITSIIAYQPTRAAEGKPAPAPEPDEQPEPYDAAEPAEDDPFD